MFRAAKPRSAIVIEFLFFFLKIRMCFRAGAHNGLGLEIGIGFGLGVGYGWQRDSISAEELRGELCGRMLFGLDSTPLCTFKYASLYLLHSREHVLSTGGSLRLLIGSHVVLWVGVVNRLHGRTRNHVQSSYKMINMNAAECVIRCA